ncbi:hypothetical protein GCM10027562_03840 [Arthrobacter pigmenti]
MNRAKSAKFPAMSMTAPFLGLIVDDQLDMVVESELHETPQPCGKPTPFSGDLETAERQQ